MKGNSNRSMHGDVEKPVSKAPAISPERSGLGSDDKMILAKKPSGGLHRHQLCSAEEVKRAHQELIAMCICIM